MTSEIRFWLARLNANYWFYPATFAVLGALIALGMIWLDRNGFAEFLNEIEMIVPVRPKGASDILTVMASAMIGVASTVFSITLVAVTYASGTYGPRLLTNFLEDRGNQISLATFIGSFVYALVVLRAVRAEDESPTDAAISTGDALPGFAPQLSLLFAYILLALCVAVLVYFLHHVPASIRINSVLESIGKRLLRAIKKDYPSEDARHDADDPKGGDTVHATSEGYVQMIDYDDLAKLARKNDCTFSMRVRVGDFVHRGMPILDVEGCDPDDIEDDARGCFTLGSVRTPEQDPQFLIDELVEIGLRALSPGINDPFTAITALHWLGAAISEIGRRDLRKRVCSSGEKDEESERDCPVIPKSDGFTHYVERSFGSIRSGVATSVNAAMVMLEVLENAATPLDSRERSRVLHDQGRLLVEQAEKSLSGPDLDRLRDRHIEFETAFASRG